MELHGWQVAIGFVGSMVAMAGFCWTIVRYLLDATAMARSERMEQIEALHKRIDHVSAATVRRDDFHNFAARMDVDLRGLRAEHLAAVQTLRGDMQRHHEALLAHLRRDNRKGEDG